MKVDEVPGLVHLISLTFPNVCETSILTMSLLQVGRLRATVSQRSWKGMERSHNVSHPGLWIWASHEEVFT